MEQLHEADTGEADPPGPPGLQEEEEEEEGGGLLAPLYLIQRAARARVAHRGEDPLPSHLWIYTSRPGPRLRTGIETDTENRDRD